MFLGRKQFNKIAIERKTCDNDYLMETYMLYAQLFKIKFCAHHFLCFLTFLEIFFVYLRKNMYYPIVMVKFDDIFF